MAEEGDRPSSTLTQSSNGNGNANSSSSSSVARQRKKRKWDQPAEAFASILPLAGGVAGVGLPGMLTALARVFPAVPTTAEASPTVSVHQNATTIMQKISQDLATKGLIPQPKIQDEVIAREIVINDAEPGIRYKLTKRQTQEEVQKKTGAVVITRGRYKPPNGPADQEKPLYLHISAGSHLMETVDRIKAVDHAAAIVEEMLRQSRQNSQLSAGMPIASLTAAVYVGLEADNSNILISRIRGPNVSPEFPLFLEDKGKGMLCNNVCLILLNHEFIHVFFTFVLEFVLWHTIVVLMVKGETGDDFVK